MPANYRNVGGAQTSTRQILAIFPAPEKEAWTKTTKTQVGQGKGGIFCKRPQNLSQIPQCKIISAAEFPGNSSKK